jgi:hypothetical protein
LDSIHMEVKIKIAALAREKLHSQLAEIKQQLADLSSSSAEEGKSSAGDKYETQREMIKQSQDILDQQLFRTQNMISQLEKIPLQTFDQVQEGALVKLRIGQVWFGVALGKIVDQETEYLLVSTDSPLYLAIRGLRTGESTFFRGNKLVVEAVI